MGDRSGLHFVHYLSDIHCWIRAISQYDSAVYPRRFLSGFMLSDLTGFQGQAKGTAKYGQHLIGLGFSYFM
jgi:hypothetical protein